MRKHKIFAMLGLFLLLAPLAKADEGMWLPLMLEKLIGDMKANGFKLTAEDVYSVNKSSMKDAVVWFGRGCTGEVVSSEGLILTNHHCGYGSIQSHSSVENDYLTDGFWAMERDGELPNPGLTVTFIVRMEEVTDRVLAGTTPDMDEMERQRLIEQNMASVRETAIEGTHYDALVRDFYYGNQYFMFITETFTDIRLVGAPPSSIGKFGGDTDNWMWPRHTGDFAVFRIYAGKDNKPAEYSTENVPYQPRYHFPVSVGNISEGDFAMVYGFPGRTQHFIPTRAVQYVQQVANPARIGMRETSLGLMNSYMQGSDKVRIQYAARYASISNYYKKWIGENTGLRRLDALAKKQAFEDAFKARASLRKPEYVDVLANLNKLHSDLEKFAFARDLFVEMAYYGPQDIRYASEFRNLAMNHKALKKEGKLEEELKKLTSLTKSHFKNYHQPLEKEVFTALFEMYLEKIDPAFHPQAAQQLQTKYSGDLQKMTDEVYAGSVLTSEEKALALLEDFDKKSIEKLMTDPVYQLADDFFSIYFTKVQPYYSSLSAEIEAGMGAYVKAQQELFPDQTYWPDANSTLRISYGQVRGSAPRDGMMYRHYTTMEGIMQKQEASAQPSDEFYVPQKLTDLYKDKDFGPYAQDGEMWVCFTASNHTTGGNSGSPVINGNGQLIGINFDRSWESTMSDIMYDADRCRNIIVDIRYVLFIIDKFAGATHLVEEMTLVKS